MMWSYKQKAIRIIFVATVFFASSVVAHASPETFCSDLPTIKETIALKKQAHMSAWSEMQEKHEEMFGEHKKNFAVLRGAYASRRVTPTFTESTKRGEVARVEAMQTRLEQTQAFFNERRQEMRATLEDVERLEGEAYLRAEDACRRGEADTEVAQVFKEDMDALRTLIQERGQDAALQKDKAEVFQAKTSKPKHGGNILFFNTPLFRK